MYKQRLHILTLAGVCGFKGLSMSVGFNTQPLGAAEMSYLPEPQPLFSLSL